MKWKLKIKITIWEIKSNNPKNSTRKKGFKFKKILNKILVTKEIFKEISK